MNCMRIIQYRLRIHYIRDGLTKLTLFVKKNKIKQIEGIKRY